MTGFGSAEDRVLRGRLRIEIRTVNHRYFNPQLKLPADLAWRGDRDARAAAPVARARPRGGHGALGRHARSRTGSPIDLSRAKQVVAAAQQLKKKLKLKGTVDLAFVARQPDVLTSTNGASEQPVNGRMCNPSSSAPRRTSSRCGNEKGRRWPRS